MKINLEDIKKTIRRDFKEAKEFYLEEDRIEQLGHMGRLKSWFFTSIWLFKGMYLKLTTVRRILLVGSLILIFISISATIGETNVRLDSNLKILGGIILLFILMLELKDKLLARDELVAGRTVQEALLPEESPEIPGWDVWLYSKPANDVGGDLIDYIRVSKNRFGITLGDVSGKGLPAALFMAKLQSTLRALVTEFDSISELANKINEIFHRDTVPKNFASLIYLELDSGSSQIDMLNAGHIPPLILRGNNILFLGKGDRALGISAKVSYRSKKVDIEPEDMLVIYSDGVTESQNESGEFFGQDRLEACVRKLSEMTTSEAGPIIVEEVLQFTGEAPQHDDLSIVLIKKN
jgi:sigma-B regulation protein RsbU (phosphoserine phosphatase)